MQKDIRLYLIFSDCDESYNLVLYLLFSVHDDPVLETWNIRITRYEYDFTWAVENSYLWLAQGTTCSPRVREVVGSIHDRVSPYTLKVVVSGSLPSTRYLRGIKIYKSSNWTERCIRMWSYGFRSPGCRFYAINKIRLSVKQSIVQSWSIVLVMSQDVKP